MGGWKKCTGVMAVATEMVLQWYCLLNNAVCSTTIDCCSTFWHKLLDAERCVTSFTLLSGWNIHISATFHVSAYTQLHVTNSHPQFSSVYTQLLLTSPEYLHNNPICNLLSTSYCKQCDLKVCMLRSIELQNSCSLLFDYLISFNFNSDLPKFSGCLPCKGRLFV